MTAHLDREKAAPTIWAVIRGEMGPDRALNALEACVVPDPPQTINRDAYEALGNLREQVDEDGHGWIDADEFSRAFALVRPAAGITLTPEEAQDALSWIEVENEFTRPLIAKLQGKQ